jgi:hypothetical protein
MCPDFARPITSGGGYLCCVTDDDRALAAYPTRTDAILTGIAQI